MSRLALFATLVVLFALLPTSGSAQTGNAASAFITAATATFQQAIPVDTLVVNQSVAASCPNADVFTVDATTHSFDFADANSRNDCGKIGTVIDLPSSSRAVFGFSADRNINQDQLQRPISAYQLFQMNSSTGESVLDVGYFNSTSGNAPSQRFFYELTPLAAGRYNVSWYFRDDSFNISASTTVPQRFQSHVEGLRLYVFNVPLKTKFVSSQERILENVSVERTIIQLNLQPILARGVENVSIPVDMEAGTRLIEIGAPDGSLLNITRLNQRQTDKGAELQLDSQALAGHGVGNYLFIFESSHPLPPAPAPPPPPAPTTIYPLAILLIALPAVPAAMATRSSIGLRTAADRRHRPFVSHVFGVDVAFIIVYVGLFAYVLLEEQLSRMAVLPLDWGSLVLYSEFLILTGLFLFLWVAPTRRVVGLMQRDLVLSEEVQEQLRRSNRELEQFAYVASHDLQEPLRTIAGFSQLLSSQYGKTLDKRARHWLDLNVSSAKRMQMLIQGLLAYSRLESSPLKKVPVDLNGVLADVRRDVEKLRADAKGTIQVLPLPVVDGDPLQMRQLFLNLVQNALKYRDPKRAPVVWVSAEEDADHHIIVVRDNGRGIDPKFSERVFEMFQRLEPRDSPIEGTGLGLAVVKRIAARHDGRVWLEPAPGGGSIFRISLPKER